MAKATAKKSTKRASAKKTVKTKAAKKPVKIVKSKSAKTNLTKKVDLSFRQKVLIGFGFGVVALGFGIWLWWSSIVMNPDRALNDMLRGNLKSVGVTKTISQNTAKQSIRLYFQPEPMAQTSTVLTQEGPTGNSSVTTETIGTKKADFVRYTDINTGGAATPGLDEIVNVWASQSSEENPLAQPAFLNEASLAIMPFGNLDDQGVQKVMSAIQENQVYEYDSVQKKWNNGRPILVYLMNVSPSKLIEVLKVYSEVTGVGDPSQLNPADYAQAPDLKLEVAVDALSRQLINVSYPDNGRNEVYSGYGLRNLVDIPSDPISINELQTKIQNLSRQQYSQ